MVLAGDHDVSHSRVLRNLHPLSRVELYGIKLASKSFIIRDRDVAVVHDPLADPVYRFAVPFSARDRIETPMNEHSESRFTEPSHALVALGLRFLCRRGKGADNDR